MRYAVSLTASALVTRTLEVEVPDGDEASAVIIAERQALALDGWTIRSIDAPSVGVEHVEPEEKAT